MSDLTHEPNTSELKHVMNIEDHALVRLRSAYHMLLEVTALVDANRDALVKFGSSLVNAKVTRDDIVLEDVLFGLNEIGAELYAHQTVSFPEEFTDKQQMDDYLATLDRAREEWIQG